METIPTIRKFISDVGWVLIGQAIALLMSFLVRVAIGRVLGADDLGLYAMSFTIFNIAALVCGIGISGAMVKFVAENKEAENRHTLNSFISSGLITGVVFSIIIGLALFFTSGILADLFNMPALSNLIKICTIAIPFSVLSDNLLLGLFTGLREMKLYAIGITSRSILLLGLAVLFVKIGWGTTGAVSSITIAYAASFILLLFLATKHFHFSLNNYFQTSKRLISFGTQLFFTNAIWTLNMTADRLLIGYFLAEKNVGIYAIALAIASAFQIIPAVVSRVTYPMMSEYNGMGMYRENEIFINKTIKYVLIFQSTLGILVIFFARDIISLLVGSEFLPAATPLTILILGWIFFGASASVGSVYSASGRPDLGYKELGPVVIIQIILDIILIPILGIEGAAIGTAIPLLLLVILDFYFYRKINTVLDWRNYVRMVILVAPVITLFHIFNGHLNFFLLICLLFGAFIIFVARFAFTKEDVKYLKETISQFFQNRKGNDLSS